MAIKNYYLILGVPRNESLAGIRAAYRDLVKRFHPDLAGESGAAMFREVVEAYEVLSDPERRRKYNQTLLESERSEQAPGILRQPVTEVEPLVPEPASIFQVRESVRPSFDEMFDRFVRNFTGARVPKAEREQGLNIEVVLTPEEAMRGGVLPVGVPVFETCPFCHGTGVDWLFPCLECGTAGLIERRETVRIRIPPMVRPGTVFEIPLRSLGIHNFYLRVHLRVGRE